MEDIVTRVITKADIEYALSDYDVERSFTRIGPILYIMDYLFLPSTMFYYELKDFFNINLYNTKMIEPLSCQQINTLEMILEKFKYIVPNSFNSSIVNLYTEMENAIMESMFFDIAR